MGSGNPGDKPGYKVVTLNVRDDVATQELNDLEAQGYTVRFFSNDRVILDNYDKTK